MSHFSVAVFTKEKPDYQMIENMLDPFWEGDGSQNENMPYFQFVDETESYKKEYEDSVAPAIKMLDGKLFSKYNDSFWQKNEKGRTVFVLPEEGQEVEVPYKELYPTFEDFMFEYYGMKSNEDGKYGRFENHNAKWDWYSIGGRWGDMLKTKDGCEDTARVSEVDFDSMKEEKLKNLTPYEDYIKDGFLKEEYLREMYPTEDEYKERVASFTTYAVITPDGVWMAPGEMGWFGLSSETAEDGRSWDLNYHKFLEEYNDCWITIVDCHI